MSYIGCTQLAGYTTTIKPNDANRSLGRSIRFLLRVTEKLLVNEKKKKKILLKDKQVE